MSDFTIPKTFVFNYVNDLAPKNYTATLVKKDEYVEVKWVQNGHKKKCFYPTASAKYFIDNGQWILVE